MTEFTSKSISRAVLALVFLTFVYLDNTSVLNKALRPNHKKIQISSQHGSSDVFHKMFFSPQILSFQGLPPGETMLFLTAQAVPLRENNNPPGIVTLRIAMIGIDRGYVTNTAAVPATGFACIANTGTTATSQPSASYERTPYIIIDGTHIRLKLSKEHPEGSTITIGFQCDNRPLVFINL